MALRSKQFAHIVDLVSEGEIEGLVDGEKSIYINNIPIIAPNGNVNHQGVVIDSRYGTADQTAMVGLGGIEAEHTTNQPLDNGTPIVQPITDDEVDALRVTIDAVNLMVQDSKGRLFSNSVIFKVEVDPGTGTYALAANKVGRTYASTTITNNASNLITIATISDTTGVDFYYSWYTPGSTETITVSTGSLWLDQWYATNDPQAIQKTILDGTPPDYLLEYKYNGGSWTTFSSGTFPDLPVDGTLTEYAYSIRVVDYSLPFGTYDFRLTTTSGTGECYVGGDAETDALRSGSSVTVPTYKVIDTVGVDGVADTSFGTSGATFFENRVIGTRLSSNGIIRGYNYGGDITITGQTQSPVSREYRFPIPPKSGAGTRSLRVTKISPDYTNTTIGGGTYSNVIRFKSFTEIIEDKLSYPNSAYFYLIIDAEPFNGRIPSRAYELNLLKIQIPSNYNPHTRVYTGTWDGTFVTAWSNNPAWVFFDLATNPRYGLGDYITSAQVDKWSLYTIAKYCDESVDSGFGYSEPRFSCNVYFQKREDAYTVLQNLASVFRGLTYWNMAQLVSIQDAPKDSVAIFSQSNVKEGVFSYSGSSRKARHSIALVSWNDPEDLYRSKIEYVEDKDSIDKYGIRQLDVVATGCTSRGQAHRLGKWMLFSEAAETEVVSFSAGLDNAGIVPGDIIKVLDASRAGIRYSGRLQVVSASSITIDSAITLSTGITYTIMITLPKGAIIDLPDGNTRTSTLGEIYETTFTVGSDGDYTVIPISPSFTTLPLVNSVWAVSEPNLVPQEFRVLAISQQSEGEIDCTALEYNFSKFATIEQNVDLVLETNSITQYSPDPIDITSLSISDTIRIGTTGAIETDLFLDWDEAANSNYYIIEYRFEHTEGAITTDSGWIRETNNHPGTDIIIANVNDGDDYFFRIFSANDLGGISNYSETTTAHTVVGKSALPEDIANFSNTIQIYSIKFTWDAVSDVDLSHYEIRSGTTWSSGGVVATNINALEYTTTQQVSGTYDYMIKAVDTSGNYSATEDTTQVIIANPDNVTSFTATERSQDVLLTWDAVSNENVAGYEVRKGVTWSGGTILVTGHLSTSFIVPLESVLGLSYYTIKAIDSAGNVSDSEALTSYTVGAPADVADFTITKQRTDMLLSWTAASLTTYEIRGGASWDGGTVLVTNHNSSTFLVDEEVEGTFKYFIKATDNVDNVSVTPAQVSISLVAPSTVTNFVVVQSGDRTEFAWDTGIATEFVTEYEIRQGSTWSSSVLIANTAATTHTLRSSFDNSTLPYLIKAIAAPGIYADTAASFVSTLYVASPTTGNILLTQDEHGSWTGNRINMSIYNTTELKQDNNSGANSEYLFEVDLTSETLARNSMAISMNVVATDPDTWANSTYAWNSAEALRSWAVGGANSNAVSFTPQIARDIGLNSGEIDGFGLNSTTTSYSGTTATTSGTIAYDFCRFSKGLIIDTVGPVQVRWVKSATANNFSSTFWIKVVDLYDIDYIRFYNTSTTKYLKVHYDNTTKEMILEDSAAVQLKVSITLAADDIVLVGIDQTLTDRTLYVGRLFETALSSTAATAPIDSFDEVRLY